MKRIFTRIGISTLAAGLLFSGTALSAAESVNNACPTTVCTETAFWKKKDKEVAPEVAPEETPTPEKEGAFRQDTSSFVRYYRNPSPDTSQDTQRNNTGNPGTQNQQNPQNQQNQQGQPGQQNQQNQQQNQQNQQSTPGQNNRQNQPQSQAHPADYSHSISQEIHKILANQPAINIDPNAYIVQHEDGLWLVMGNIKAKLEILIYVDQKNMQHMQEYDNNPGMAIPLYK